MPREGRPRSFDETEVLEQATELFWRRGYTATSVGELGDHVGLKPGSLYAAFGNKHALFLRALDRYADRQRELTDVLGVAEPVLPVLRGALLAVLRAAREAPGRGCMLGNTSVDVLPADAQAATVVRRALDELTDAIRSALERAQRAGEVRADVDATDAARLLVALMQGLHVVARSATDPMELAGTVDTALAALA